MSDVDDARKRVRQLLLSGDNTLKHRADPVSVERARGKFQEALGVAQEAGLDEDILEIIRRRLEPDGPVDAA